jgi:hypothetical protein
MSLAHTRHRSRRIGLRQIPYDAAHGYHSQYAGRPWVVGKSLCRISFRLETGLSCETSLKSITAMHTPAKLMGSSIYVKLRAH